MVTTQYNNLLIRIATAFLGAIFILFHGRWEGFLRAFTFPSFYVALVVSFTVAMLLVYIIHRGTIWLDRYYSWRDKPLERTSLQIGVGLFLPALTDLVLISIHLAFRGENIFDTGFLQIDFPVIFIFLILVNLYYVIHDLYITGKSSESHPMITIEHNGRFFALNMSTEVIYASQCGTNVDLLCMDGSEYSTMNSLRHLQEEFGDHCFCRINRQSLINMRYVRGCESIPNEQFAYVIFKSEVLPLVEHRKTGDFLITTDYIEKFKQNLLSSVDISM